MASNIGFRQRDATRLCKSVNAAGLDLVRIRVLPDGTLEADVAKEGAAQHTIANEWDEVLDEQ